MCGATREHYLLATRILNTRLSRAMVVLSRLVLLLFRKNYIGPTTPIPEGSVWTFPFSLALLRESHTISFTPVTKIFQFTGLPTSPINWVVPHYEGVSPFGHPRIKANLAAPRGLSQPITSFFGIFCQGILRAPLNEHYLN